MISVIVLTSPGREENLRYCLRALKQQTFQQFECLVADDGSSLNAGVLAETGLASQGRYLWRPNDYCMSRSYNLAVAQARYPQLVLLSADVLLNPHALGYYAGYFAALPPMLIYGYFGNVREYISTSSFFPERQINLQDCRFGFPQGQLRCHPLLPKEPQKFAWGGNWSVPKAWFDKVGGFNEAFRGWGLEDVDFANRLMAHLPISFSVDVWGEHQIHPLEVDQTRYDANEELMGPLHPVRQEPGLLYDPARTELKQLRQYP